MGRKRLIRAYLIDVASKEIKEVEYKDSLDEIYKLLDCSLIDRIYLENGLCVYIDDEGAFTDKNSFYAKTQNNMELEIIGNGLIVDTNFETGETISVVCSIDEIKKYINFDGGEFNDWIRTFFLEKNISIETQLESGYSLKELLKILRVQNDSIKETIKNRIIEIDFANGDILHFINFLTKGIK